MINVAVIGAVHDHLWPVWGKGYIRELQEDAPSARLIAAAEPNEKLSARLSSESKIPSVYSDWRKMVKEQKPDAVILGLPNDDKADVIEELCDAGIHVLMDKPMSATLEQSERIYAAGQNSGSTLMVNWPSAWRPALHELKALVESGAIGEPYWMSARTANPGPEIHGASDFFLEWLYNEQKNGGGALIDYACYGIKYACWMFGEPGTVMASAGHFVKDNIPAPMEDNAIVIMGYDKMRAVSEGSWTQFGANHAFEADKSTGSVTVYGSTGEIRAAHKRNYIELVSEAHPDGLRIDPAPLPVGYRNGPEYFIHCIETGEKVTGMTSPEVGLSVQRVIDAGYRSLVSKAEVSLGSD